MSSKLEGIPPHSPPTYFFLSAQLLAKLLSPENLTWKRNVAVRNKCFQQRYFSNAVEGNQQESEATFTCLASALCREKRREV